MLIDFTRVANPPVRLPFGSDTLVAIAKKHADDVITAAWHNVAASTDFAH